MKQPKLSGLSWHARSAKTSAAWLCFWLSLLCAILSLGWFLIRGHGVLSITSDFNRQQLPFYYSARKSIQDGGLYGFSWDVGYGTSTLQAYSFYNLGSLTFWISFLFPTTALPYLSGIFYIVKYVLAALTAFFYCVRFVKKPNYAVMGGILYAFSGYQAEYTLFHFQGAIAVFPLMLIGLEKVMQGEKSGKQFFVLSVFLTAIDNYFFLVLSVVFLVIYYCIRFGTMISRGEKKQFFRSIPRLLLCGILGIGMASVLFVPSIYFVLHNTRVLQPGFYDLVWSNELLLYVLKCMLLPPEALSSQSIVFEKRFDLSSCYLPLIGWSFCFAYMLKNKDWLRRILIFLMVCSLSPFLSSMFLGFSNLYFRWWHMMILMMALASVLVAERIDEYPVRKGALISAGVTTLFYLAVRYATWKTLERKVEIFSLNKLNFGLVLILAGDLTVFLLTLRKMRQRYAVLLASVCCCSFGTNALVIHEYRANASSTPEAYEEELRVCSQIDVDAPQYRIDMGEDQMGNMNLVAKKIIGSGYTFSSTMANSTTEFLELYDYKSVISTAKPAQFEGMAQLLGEKYYLTRDKGTSEAVQTIRDGDDLWYVIEKDAAPIGFAVDQYLTGEELRQTDVQNRTKAMMCAAVVSDEDAARLQGKYRHVSVDAIDYSQSPDEFARAAEKNKVQNFQRGNSEMSFTTDYTRDRLVSLSVSYDEGWTAELDGKPLHIMDQHGFMLVEVPAGRHTITFHYKTPLAREGAAVSLVSWIIFIIWTVSDRRRQRAGKNR